MRLYNKRDENSIIIDTDSVDKILEFIKSILSERIYDFVDFGPNFKPAILRYINETITGKYNINTYIKNCIGILNSILVDKYKCKNTALKRLYLGYYIEIGVKEPQKALSKEQQKRSPRCVEYWLNKGFSLEYAKNKVSEYQSTIGYYSAEKLKVDYWLQAGFSIKEAEEQANTQRIKIASSSKEHMKMMHGYSDEEIKQIQKEKYNGRDVKKYAAKHNVTIEEAERYIADIINRSRRCGSENGMYGRPSPLKSGAAYSGYYKEYLFRSLPEYYFIKYNEDKGIKSAEKDFAIKLTNGKTYHPDFVIGKTIYEIKADYMMNNPETIQKVKELGEAFPEYEIKLISASSIKPLDKETILSDIKNNNLRIVSNKQERFNKYLEGKF